MSPAAIKQRRAEHCAWERECETPSNWEVIACWVTVGIATACTVATVGGVTGYLWIHHGAAITTLIQGFSK